MTITIRQPQITSHPNWNRLIVVAVVAAIAATSYISVQVITGDSATTRPVANTVDTTGLGEVFGAEVPTTATSPRLDTSLGDILVVQPDALSQAPVIDTTGLGEVFGVEFPATAPGVDTSLGDALAVQFDIVSLGPVDSSGLGAAISVAFPTLTSHGADTSLGDALAVQYPTK